MWMRDRMSIRVECYNDFVVGMCAWLRKEQEFMADEEDFLEELITERTKCNPNIPAMIEAELQRRRDARASRTGFWPPG